MIKKGFLINGLWVVCFSIAAFGCSDDDDDADTDTETDTDTGTDLIDLSEVIGDQAVVVLDGDIGEMTFDFDPPLDVSQREEMEELLGDAINVTVINNETSVTYSLTSGTLVQGEPAGAGEYSFDSADGSEVVLRFFNGFDGNELLVGNEYSALIEVTTNSYFASESFTVTVDIELP